MAKQCPHCERWALKDTACNFVVCGRATHGFVSGAGCGRAWCFECGLKLCGRYYDARGAATGLSEDHTHAPGPLYDACNGDGFCPGGHDSHKLVRATPGARAPCPDAT